MRRHVLFLVHGMGDNVTSNGLADPGWADAAKNTIEQIYNNYQIPSLIPFDQRFEVVPINYDSVFDTLLSRWAEQSVVLRSTGVPITGIVDDVFNWLEGAARQDDNFAWTHVVDVVLYRFFSLVRQRVKTHVAKQFFAALKPTNDGAVTSWSVIAHSLGTMVTHDVLHAMDSTTPNEGGISVLDAMVPSANVVAMVSNVSKVLENDIGVYDSLVVPPTTIKPSTTCFHYLNVNNKFDSFASSEKFNPAGNPEWDLAKRNKTYLNVKIDNVHEVNVHSFSNYLKNPKVHIPLLELMLGRGSITDADKEAAENFPKFDNQQLFDQAKQIFKDSKSAAWFEVVGKYFGQLGNVPGGNQ